MDGPLKVDETKPRLIVAGPSYWDNAKKQLVGWKSQMDELNPQIHKVPINAKVIGYRILAKVDEIGATLPDLVTPIKRFFSPTE